MCLSRPNSKSLRWRCTTGPRTHGALGDVQEPYDLAWLPRRDCLSSLPIDPERGRTSLVWVLIVGDRRQLKQVGPPLLDVVHGKLEEEAPGRLPLQ